jgi:hypothetical protein
VDCGGFVAAYWGEEVPHMVEPNPKFATGISPRSIWADSGTTEKEAVLKGIGQRMVPENDYDCESRADPARRGVDPIFKMSFRP